MMYNGLPTADNIAFSYNGDGTYYSPSDERDLPFSHFIDDPIEL